MTTYTDQALKALDALIAAAQQNQQILQTAFPEKPSIRPNSVVILDQHDQPFCSSYDPKHPAALSIKIPDGVNADIACFIISLAFNRAYKALHNEIEKQPDGGVKAIDVLAYSKDRSNTLRIQVDHTLNTLVVSTNMPHLKMNWHDMRTEIDQNIRKELSSSSGWKKINGKAITYELLERMGDIRIPIIDMAQAALNATKPEITYVASDGTTLTGIDIANADPIKAMRSRRLIRASGDEIQKILADGLGADIADIDQRQAVAR